MTLARRNPRRRPGRHQPRAHEAAHRIAEEEVARQIRQAQNRLPRASPLYSEEGAITAATIVLQDVTRLMRFDELKNNLNQMIDNLRKAQTDLQASEARRRLQTRPGVLIQKEDCLDCEYLTLCHGGCPVRAYTVHGDILRKDPYCQLYRKLFQDVEEMAAKSVDSGVTVN